MRCRSLPEPFRENGLARGHGAVDRDQALEDRRRLRFQLRALRGVQTAHRLQVRMRGDRREDPLHQHAAVNRRG
jgi:hypothetical protein